MNQRMSWKMLFSLSWLLESHLHDLADLGNLSCLSSMNEMAHCGQHSDMSALTNCPYIIPPQYLHSSQGPH